MMCSGEGVTVLFLLLPHTSQLLCNLHHPLGGRGRGREGERGRGREGGREAGREEEREGGRKARREGGREGGKKGRRETQKGRKKRRKEMREGGREGGREGDIMHNAVGTVLVAKKENDRGEPDESRMEQVYLSEDLAEGPSSLDLTHHLPQDIPTRADLVQDIEPDREGRWYMYIHVVPFFLHSSLYQSVPPSLPPSLPPFSPSLPPPSLPLSLLPPSLPPSLPPPSLPPSLSPPFLLHLLFASFTVSCRNTSELLLSFIFICSSVTSRRPYREGGHVKESDGQTERWTDRQTGRQTDRRTGRQMDRRGETDGGMNR